MGTGDDTPAPPPPNPAAGRAQAGLAAAQWEAAFPQQRAPGWALHAQIFKSQHGWLADGLRSQL